MAKHVEKSSSIVTRKTQFKDVNDSLWLYFSKTSFTLETSGWPTGHSLHVPALDQRTFFPSLTISFFKSQVKEELSSLINEKVLESDL